MKRNILVAAAAALLVGIAHASDFAAEVTGSGEYQFVDPMASIGTPGGCNPSVDPMSTACQFGIVDITWTGRLDVVTAGDSGTFTDASGIEGITFTSNLGSFSWAPGDVPQPTLPGQPGSDLWMVGLASAAEVTIVNDRISSFSAIYNTSNATFSFSELSARGTSANGSENSDSFQVINGALDPIPEPPAPAFLLAGIALLAARRLSTSRE